MQRGFTLIEILIYTAILAIAAVMVIQSILVLIPSFNELRRTEVVNRNAVAVLERTVREVRDANSVDLVGSTFDTHPGTVVLNVTGGSRTVYAENGRVFIEEGGDPVALTQTGAFVDSLIFTYATTTSGEAVQVELTLSTSRGNSTTTATFHSGAVLRGSY